LQQTDLRVPWGTRISTHPHGKLFGDVGGEGRNAGHRTGSAGHRNDRVVGILKVFEIIFGAVAWRVQIGRTNCLVMQGRMILGKVICLVEDGYFPVD
jgi:hypothetical protein